MSLITAPREKRQINASLDLNKSTIFSEVESSYQFIILLLSENFDELKHSQSKGFLIISDQIFDDKVLENGVVYRPPTLVVGIGLHWDTSKETIKSGLESSLQKFNLSVKSIARFVSIKKEKDVVGLIELGKEMDIPIEYIDREKLASISTPNPSKTVQKFEGTSSVSEAAAIKSSGGKLIVEKQKFPPNLTIAIGRIQN